MRLNKATCINEIEARGGETRIVGKYEEVRLQLVDRKPSGFRWLGTRNRVMALVRCQGWRQYSRAFGARQASLCYLCGLDDNGPWAVRVPGTIRTVIDALEWMVPKQVQAALKRGRRVLRQGDVYAIETTRQHDGNGSDELPENHWWLPGNGRWLLHTDHNPLQVPFPARFVTQNALEMGRSGRFGFAD